MLEKENPDIVSLGMVRVFKFSHVLDKCLLMRHPGILAIAQDAYIPQSKFYKALIDEVHGGMDVKSYRCLLKR